MSLKSFIFRKKIERHLPTRDSALNPTTGGLKAYLRTSYLLYIKPQLTKGYNALKFIGSVPFPILFCFFLLFIFITFGIFQQIESKKWITAISTLYPESIMGTIDPETGRLMPSPLDSVMIPYNAKVLAQFFIIFHMGVVTFMNIIWKLHHDGAPQSFKLKGYNG